MEDVSRQPPPSPRFLDYCWQANWLPLRLRRISQATTAAVTANATIQNDPRHTPRYSTTSTSGRAFSNSLTFSARLDFGFKVCLLGRLSLPRQRQAPQVRRLPQRLQIVLFLQVHDAERLQVGHLLNEREIGIDRKLGGQVPQVGKRLYDRDVAGRGQTTPRTPIPATN